MNPPQLLSNMVDAVKTIRRRLHVSSSPYPPHHVSSSHKPLPYIIPHRETPHFVSSLDGQPLVELYHVTVLNWDKSMFQVFDYMKDKSFKIIVEGTGSSMMPEVIYQCDDPVPLGIPLYLKGPRFPHNADSDFFIYLVQSKWCFRHRDRDRSLGTSPVDVFHANDRHSDSKAKICYGVFNSAVVARLEFRIVANGDLSNYEFKISAGSCMSVTTDGRPDTYRRIRKFSDDERVKVGDFLQVDRASFVVPTDSNLTLDLDLEIFSQSPTIGLARPARINGKIDFSMPKRVGRKVIYLHPFKRLPPGDATIEITVNWRNGA